MQEIIIILVVALIVIGPKKLPELARTLGKGLAEFKKAADDLQETVRMDLERDKHEQFSKKYPDLVPEGEESADAEAMADKETESEVKIDADVTVEGEPATTTAEVTPEPAPEPEDEPEISYNPEEIEGGDETEDDPSDDPPDEPRNV
jgi:TatA/E family protein of Tat protein translocase